MSAKSRTDLVANSTHPTIYNTQEKQHAEAAARTPRLPGGMRTYFVHGCKDKRVYPLQITHEA